MQGHKLEEVVKEAFPQLKEYHNAHELKKVIINKWGNIPDYIPSCFVDIFNDIMYS